VARAEERRSRVEEDTEVAAARAGDESAFAGLVERYRRELQVHCYRMLGSYQDSEDMVQETFLRAWRKREGFQGRSTFRAWLYRIAPNACLDALARRPRRVLPYDVVPLAMDPNGSMPEPGGYACWSLIRTTCWTPSRPAMTIPQPRSWRERRSSSRSSRPSSICRRGSARY
jgi:hypothetical protein